MPFNDPIGWISKTNTLIYSISAVKKAVSERRSGRHIVLINNGESITDGCH